MNTFKHAKRKYDFVTVSYWVKRPPSTEWQQHIYRTRRNERSCNELLIGAKTGTLVVTTVQVAK